MVGRNSLLLTPFLSEHRFVFRNFWQNEHNTRMNLCRRIPCLCSETI